MPTKSRRPLKCKEHHITDVAHVSDFEFDRIAVGEIIAEPGNKGHPPAFGHLSLSSGNNLAKGQCRDRKGVYAGLCHLLDMGNPKVQFDGYQSNNIGGAAVVLPLGTDSVTIAFIVD